MAGLIRAVLKFLNTPTGFRAEWMTGGFEFTPPLYAWILLEVVLALYVVVRFELYI